MTTPDLEQMTRRLSMAEQEIARAHADISALREQCIRRGRVRAISTGVVVVAAAVAVSALWSTTTQAQGPSGPLTVRAPFVVVDGANKPIVKIWESPNHSRGLVVYSAQQKELVDAFADPDGNGLLIARDGKNGNGSGIRFEGGEPEFALKGSDSKFFVLLQREGGHVVGPFTVNDTSGKPVMVVQAESTDKVKDEKGEEKVVTTNRGAHVLNAKGQIVARSAADAEGNGQFLARDASGKGKTAALMITKEGSYVAVTDANGKTKATLKSDEGLVVYNTKGTAVGSMGTTPEGKGILELSDATGLKMVEAGSIEAGRGFIRVNPWQMRIDPLGQPSVLMGRPKK